MTMRLMIRTTMMGIDGGDVDDEKNSDGDMGSDDPRDDDNESDESDDPKLLVHFQYAVYCDYGIFIRYDEWVLIHMGPSISSMQ